jgi:hypothetical protein
MGAPAPQAHAPGFPQQPHVQPPLAPPPVAPPPGVAAAAAQPPAALDPFARMKPQAGTFDLRTIDDGQPAANVRSGRGKAALISALIVGLVAFALGAGMGMAGVGRANMNTANHAAKSVKTELDAMQKTLTQIGTAMALSQQRMVAAKKEPLSYDEQLITDLGKVKLDPRPDTSRIFRVDYFRLDDNVVDRLFNYYYDSIALYNETERHIKKTNADKESLVAFAAKQPAAGEAKNYGVVFDTSGKIVVGNLVEVGEQVCKNGGKDCAAADLQGFKVRSNTGAPFVNRAAGGKLTDEKVVPLKPTPLMDAVMSGSPDQVRNEAYKQRLANMRAIYARLSSSWKELSEGMNKAAARPDVFTPF